MQIEAAPDARTMLELHAGASPRRPYTSADLAFVVEHAAKSDERIAALWHQMVENRRDGVEWAARTLLGKPGVQHLRIDDVEQTFWVVLDWGDYPNPDRPRRRSAPTTTNAGSSTTTSACSRSSSRGSANGRGRRSGLLQ